MHTLKGGARMGGLTEVGDLAHDFEALMVKAQKGDVEVDNDFFGEIFQQQDALASSVDVVAKLLSKASKKDAVKSDVEIINNTFEQNDTDVWAVDASELTEIASTPVAVQQLTQLDQEEAVKPQQARRGPQKMVKVSANLLDDLVNLAGETSISRERLEQQITDFSYSLEEMDSTLERLRDQLRRLDIETEAQVLFRQERETPSYDDFDPLEMDRYSQMQQLARSLVESASDLLDIRESLSNKIRDAETLLLQQSRVNTELQEGLMQTSMVPFQRLVPRLRRIVRQIGQELDKPVEFKVFNADGEMERTLLERLISPLEHMLRNAVDHGIENKVERAKTDKPAQGSVELSISREGGDVLVILKDDGQGIDIDAVRQKALERGLIADDSKLTDIEIMQFILHAGFSTAQQVTQISGRGVGMDVVNSEIRQMGGTLFINSIPGQGTEFQVRLPFTVSVNRALMVRVGDDLYAVPLDSIQGIVRIATHQLEALYELPLAERTFEYGGAHHRLEYLGIMLGTEAQPKLVGQKMPTPVLLIKGETPYALQVDTLLGSREIVVKTLGTQFSSVMGVSGGTILGDGSVVIILDLPAMIRSQSNIEYQQAMELDAIEAEKRHKLKVRTKRILVVDDSVTVRKVTTRLLERNGFEVFTAKDGVDAIATLQDHIPDLMLLDIEMPRMDGFEVASIVRHDSRLKHVPIIMITSRTGDKHRNRAFSIGVNEYLGKPFQEDNLLANIEKLLAGYAEN
jgi:chemosensory pili system protein ChpA (sensor histidine kinase/response regulator)